MRRLCLSMSKTVKKNVTPRTPWPHSRWMAGPYLFWSAAFIIIPLCMIFYYGLTDNTGAFTLKNITSISSPEHIKAHFRPCPVPYQHAYLSAPCLSAGHDTDRTQGQPEKLYRDGIYFADVDEFPSPHTGMADASRKNRGHQFYPLFFRSARTQYHQHAGRHYPRHGLQLPAFLWYFRFIMRSLK